MNHEYRTAAQLREHYEVEKELAARLRQASRNERTHLYSSLYDELFRRVPNHPQLARKSSASDTAAAVAVQMKFLKRFLDPDGAFLEIGPGDCALTFEAAKFVRQAYAVDVSAEITKHSNAPSNFRLVLSDGRNIALPPGIAKVAYSNQLIEHLHPDDALDQLKSVYDVLTEGGVYLCTTPNRLGGPWDVSRYFDKVATGFHLKEYTYAELIDLFKAVGFKKISAFIAIRGRYLQAPAGVVCALERIMSRLPHRTVSALPFRLLLDMKLVGVK